MRDVLREIGAYPENEIAFEAMRWVKSLCGPHRHGVLKPSSGAADAEGRLFRARAYIDGAGEPTDPAWKRLQTLQALVRADSALVERNGGVGAPHSDPRSVATGSGEQGHPRPSGQREAAAVMEPRVDAVIVTMKEEEFEAVLDQFPNGLTAHDGQRRTYEMVTVDTPQGERRIAITRALHQGNIHAQEAVADSIDELTPGFVLVVGIAGGTPSDDFTLGDVIVANYIHDLTLEEVGAESSRFNALGGPLHVEAERIASRLPALKRTIGDWPAAIAVTRPEVTGTYTTDQADWNRKIDESFASHRKARRKEPKVRAERVASSDRLVKDPELLQRWQTTMKSIAAVEMESAGAYHAARGRDVPCLAIRGISDIVGWKRDESWTAYACHTAAAFTRALLMSGVISAKRTRDNVAIPPQEVVLAPSTTNTSMDDVSKKAAITHLDQWCALVPWPQWNAAMSYVVAGTPRLHETFYDALEKLRQSMLGKYWPTPSRIAQAYELFRKLLIDFLNEVVDTSIKEGDTFWLEKRHHIKEWNPEKYARLLRHYHVAQDVWTELAIELTRAANTLLDAMRRQDPGYRIDIPAFSLPIEVDMETINVLAPVPHDEVPEHESLEARIKRVEAEFE